MDPFGRVRLVSRGISWPLHRESTDSPISEKSSRCLLEFLTICRNSWKGNMTCGNNKRCKKVLFKNSFISTITFTNWIIIGFRNIQFERNNWKGKVEISDLIS